jgi:hypothetical protein
MLKKSLFSPARPRRAETRQFPCGVLDTCDAYLVKRRSFPDSDVSRFTNDEDERSRVTGFMPGSPFV